MSLFSSVTAKSLINTGHIRKIASLFCTSEAEKKLDKINKEFLDWFIGLSEAESPFTIRVEKQRPKK